MADALILNYNDFETTNSLVDLLTGFENIQHICVVDNRSTDNSYEELLKINHSKVDVIQSSHNGGYGYGNNLGIRYLDEHYQSEYILLCNPDVIIEDSVVGILENFLQNHSEYMVVAPWMLNAKGVPQTNTAFKIEGALSYILSYEMLYNKFVKPGEYDFSKFPNKVMDVDAVAGSLFMFDAKKMLEHGMYDENVFLYCEERMLGMKCKKAGMKMALLKDQTFIHNHSVSINKSLHSEVKKRKVMNKSGLYVIKHYYNCGVLGVLLGKLMMSISIAEMYLLERIKRKR